MLADSAGDNAAREHLGATLMELGESADADGRLTDAAANYREIVALDPSNVETRNNFGVIMARLGEMKAAIEQLETALQADPSNSAARENLERARKQPPK